MESPIYNQKGEQVGKITLPENVFGLPWNSDLVHQVVTSMLSSAREPWAHTKDRGQVAGGGKKPWQQKGTGRARHGSIRSPLWVGGGVTHGPNVKKNYDRKVNRKMKTKALFTVLSKKFKDGEVIFVDKLSFPKPKTSEAVVFWNKVSSVKGYEGLGKKKNNAALLAFSKKDKKSELSFRNIPCLATSEVKNISPVQVLNYKYICFVEPELAVKTLSSKLEVKS